MFFDGDVYFTRNPTSGVKSNLILISDETSNPTNASTDELNTTTPDTPVTTSRSMERSLLPLANRDEPAAFQDPNITEAVSQENSGNTTNTSDPQITTTEARTPVDETPPQTSPEPAEPAPFLSIYNVSDWNLRGLGITFRCGNLTQKLDNESLFLVPPVDNPFALSFQVCPRHALPSTPCRVPTESRLCFVFSSKDERELDWKQAGGTHQTRTRERRG
jgi:hypothetical protein